MKRDGFNSECFFYRGRMQSEVYDGRLWAFNHRGWGFPAQHSSARPMSVTWLMTISVTASYQRNKKHLLAADPKLGEGCNQPRGTDWILLLTVEMRFSAMPPPPRATGKGSSWITRGRARRMSLIGCDCSTLTLWLFKDIIKGFLREELQS